MTVSLTVTAGLTEKPLPASKTNAFEVACAAPVEPPEVVAKVVEDDDQAPFPPTQ